MPHNTFDHNPGVHEDDTEVVPPAGPMRHREDKEGHQRTVVGYLSSVTMIAEKLVGKAPDDILFIDPAKPRLDRCGRHPCGIDGWASEVFG